MVKIADLKNNLSRHLANVRRGGQITVLDRDTPVARIVPFVPDRPDTLELVTLDRNLARAAQLEGFRVLAG